MKPPEEENPTNGGNSKSDVPTPTMSPELPGDRGLSAGIPRIRATSRWVIVSFGAVAAILIGTAPLDKIGTVELMSDRFAVATIAAALVLLAVAVAMWAAAAVDQPVGLSAQELVAAENQGSSWKSSFGDRKRIQDAAKWIKDASLIDLDEPCLLDSNHNAVQGRKSQPIGFLCAERDAARNEWIKRQCEMHKEENADKRKELAQKSAGYEALFNRLDEQLGYTIDLANYYRIRERFDFRKSVIFVSAFVAALCIVAFKYVISIEESPRNLAGIVLTHAADADLRGANLAGARLEGAELVRTDLRSVDLTGARLARANLRFAKLGGADFTAVDLTGVTGLTPEQVKGVSGWVGATCPSGTRLHDVKDTCATEPQLKPKQ